MTTKKADNKKKIRLSLLTYLILNDLIIKDIDNTKPIFAILEPITFPKAISDSFIILAFKLTTNSGRLVPKATIVAPIIKLGKYGFVSHDYKTWLKILDINSKIILCSFF